MRVPVNVTVAVSPPVLSLVTVPPTLFGRLVGGWFWGGFVVPAGGRVPVLSGLVSSRTVGAGVRMANGDEVAEVRPVSVAVRVYGAGAVMTRLLKLATPLTASAAAVVLPSKNVPPLRASVTVEVSPVATLPKPSSSDTATEGLPASPA